MLYLKSTNEFNKSEKKKMHDHIINNEMGNTSNCGVKVSNKYLEVWLPDIEIEYLLVSFIASSAVSSAIPGKTAADLPTNAL